MAPRRLVLGSLVLLIAVPLLGASPVPVAQLQPAAPVIVTPYGLRVAAVVDAEARQLAALNQAFAACTEADEIRGIQHRIDLVKRSAELRLFELQLEAQQTRGNAEAVGQLQPLVEDLRRQVTDRSRRYGLEIPTFALPATVTGPDRR